MTSQATTTKPRFYLVSDLTGVLDHQRCKPGARATVEREFASEAQAWGEVQSQGCRMGFDLDVIETSDALEVGERICLASYSRIGARLAANPLEHVYDDDDDA